MQNVRNKAIDVLTTLGVSMAHKGFMYICDCMELVSDNEMLLTDTYELYRNIAKNRKTTVTSVEAVIRYELTNMFTKSNVDRLQEVFGTEEKLTNAVAIAEMYRYLRKDAQL